MYRSAKYIRLPVHIGYCLKAVMPSFFKLRYADFSASLIFDSNSCRRFLIHSEFGFIFPTKFEISEKINNSTYYILLIIYFLTYVIHLSRCFSDWAKPCYSPCWNGKKLLCSIWDYHTPSWVSPSIGLPLAWSCRLVRFRIPLLFYVAVRT